MSAGPSQLRQHARAWRAATLRSESGLLTVARRGDGERVGAGVTLDAPHCAELFVKTAGLVDAGRLIARLGELLRLVRLAAAPSVDPLVLNALCDDDALCAMGADSCARCDDAAHVTPAVTLAIARGWCDSNRSARSGLGLLHDALYAWPAAGASAEYRRLHDALQAHGGDDAPPVELHVFLGFFEDDGDMVLHDLQSLVSRSRALPAQPFRLVSIVPNGFAARVASPHFARLHTAIVDAGVCTQLGPNIHRRATTEEVRHAWQWLIDWTERAAASPLVKAMTIICWPGQTDMMSKLLQLVVTKSQTLRQLTFRWPLHLETDPKERRCAAEAIGAAFFAPHSTFCLSLLDLDLGKLTTDDVVAIERGAIKSESDGDNDRCGIAIPRFQSVEWNVQSSPDLCIERVGRLLGTVGVRELKLSSTYGSRGLSCGTLKAVMEDCAKTITSLKCWILECDDASELETTTKEFITPHQLRELSLCVYNELDPNTMRAMDALLALVGGSLIKFSLCAFQSGLTDRTTAILAARCPQLLTLEAPNANGRFFRDLVEAYDRRRSRISTLITQATPRGSDASWMPILDALRNPSSAASRKLHTLTLNTVWNEDVETDVEFNALVDMLSVNTRLKTVVVRGPLASDAKRQLLALPSQFSTRSPPLRCRLALISVFVAHDQAQRWAKLPPDVLTLVFDFSGRRTRRFWY